MSRPPIATPVFALILAAMLGSSGIACACALLALDAAPGAHHEVHDEAQHGKTHTPASAGEHDECSSACGAHSATAVNSKAPIATDYHSEKPAVPAAHEENTIPAHASGLPGRWRYDNPPLPLSTPVSRSDILLD